MSIRASSTRCWLCADRDWGLGNDGSISPSEQGENKTEEHRSQRLKTLKGTFGERDASNNSTGGRSLGGLCRTGKDSDFRDTGAGSLQRHSQQKLMSVGTGVSQGCRLHTFQDLPLHTRNTQKRTNISGAKNKQTKNLKNEYLCII